MSVQKGRQLGGQHHYCVSFSRIICANTHRLAQIVAHIWTLSKDNSPRARGAKVLRSRTISVASEGIGVRISSYSVVPDDGEVG